MNSSIVFDLIFHLKCLRSDILCTMSGLGHGTTKYYNYLCKVLGKIDKDIDYYSKLLEEN